MVKDRRGEADVDVGATRIGLALSGGGIRSATFCLGVLQALSGRGFLRRVDFLSTVSGGGYAGSFLGRMFTRDWVAQREPKIPPGLTEWPTGIAQALEDKKDGYSARRVEAVLDDHRSKPMQWLRESGRYISPTGAGDLFLAAAVAFRNWITVLVVVITSLLAVFLCAVTVRAALWAWPAWSGGVEPFLMDATLRHWWWSPLLLTPVVVFLIFALPLGWAYWLTQKDCGVRMEIPPWVTVALVLLGGATFAALRPIFPDRLNENAALVAATLALAAALTLAYYTLASGAAQRKAESGAEEKPPENAGIPAGGDPEKPESSSSSVATLGYVAALVVGVAVPWIFEQTAARVAGGALALMGFVFLCLDAAPRKRKLFNVMRNRLSRHFSTAFVAVGVLLVLAVVDSFGQMAYALLRPVEYELGFKDFLGVTGLLGLFAFAQRIKLLLDQLPDRKTAQIPITLLAGLAAVVVAGTLLISLSAVANGIAWQWDNPTVPPRAGKPAIIPAIRLSDQLRGTSRVKLNAMNLIEVVDEKGISSVSEPAEEMSLLWAGGWAFGCVLLAFFFGRTLTFINLSAHQTLYAARISRAYHGASNPDRWCGDGQRIGETLPTDDMLWPEYQPHASGGPLHLVNVTVNETLGGKSQVEDQDRHGMLLAVGPAGLTVGARFHALWDEEFYTRPIPGKAGETNETKKPTTEAEAREEAEKAKEAKKTAAVDPVLPLLTRRAPVAAKKKEASEKT